VYLDHVDAHRTLLMVIGSYVKRDYVSHRHSCIVSIIKTVNLILGTPPLNQYDAAAADLTDFFTTERNLTPYTALPSDKRVFDPDAITPETSIYRLDESEPLDDPETIEREHRQRIEEGRTME